MSTNSSFNFSAVVLICCASFLVYCFGKHEDGMSKFWKDRNNPKIEQWKKYKAVDPMACPVIVSREDWGARPPKSRMEMQTPVPYVVLHHTLSPDVCYTYEECCKDMRSIQNFHMDTRGWDDIAYTFLVGGDGLAYEGRGWDTVGSHAPWYNFRSIGISIIGNFTAKLPTQPAIDAVNYLINCAIANKKLDPDYVLIGHRQATPNRTCPGEALFKEMQSWPHWKPGDHFPPSNGK